MDEGLRIQVELHRKGEKIFSKIKRDIARLSEEEELEYLLSTETMISISNDKIWVYGIIGNEFGREICTVSTFDNIYGSRKVVKEILHFYLVNSGYSYDFDEDLISEKEMRSVIKIFSRII